MRFYLPQGRTNAVRSAERQHYRPLTSTIVVLFLLALIGSTIGPKEVSAQTAVLPPTFSKMHGLFSASFSLALTSPSGGSIYYTTNGSTPTTTSTKYTSALSISKTTVVRAIASVNGINSSVVTQSYIFLASVRTQKNSDALAAGWPTKFAADDTKGGPSHYPSDYEIDPDVTKSYTTAAFDNAMTSLPSMSIVTDLPNLWNEKTGIYWNSNAKEGDPIDPYAGPGVLGKWERPISLEYIDPKGITTGFTVTGGLRINGQASRRPYRTPKKSFRVYFKAKDYGTDKLDFQLFDYGDAVSKFDRIVLRNGGNRNWSYFDRDQRRESDYVNDEWARRAWTQMGNLAPHGNYVHLYINGLYWGLYNVTERFDSKFVQAYMGGSDSEYSTVEADEDFNDAATADPPESIDAWTALLDAVKDADPTTSAEDPITNAQYDDIKTRVDVANLADYFIHVNYIAKTDWPHHNWNAFRKMTGPDQRFKFVPWDNDSGLNRVTENNTLYTDATPPDDAPSRIFLRLTTNAEFRQVLADRLYKHVIDPKGALTPASCAALYSKLTTIIDQAVIGESARWGDYVRDTYLITNATTLPKTIPAYLHSRDLPKSVTDPKNIYSDTMKTWVDVRDAKLNIYCPQRSDILVGQYVANGWYQTTLKTPAFSQAGGNVAANFSLKIDNTPNNGTGDIYYTTDGSDPRLEYGAVASTAINGADLVNLSITQVTKVRARVLNGTLWSPLVEYTFYPPQPFENLVISEIHYNPVPPATPVGENGDDYEFIELHNKGTTPLRLDNSYFARGLTYVFPENTTIWPGQYLVLASKDSKFQKRYGFAPFGNYRGNLSNLGETIELNQATGTQIDLVDYLPTSPWPVEANGGGSSACLKDVTLANNDGLNWKPSVAAGGTPGAAGCESAVATGGVWFSTVNDFGPQSVGRPSAPQVVTLANNGGKPLVISSITTSGDFAKTTACPAVLAVSATCTVSVVFTPTIAEPRTGALNVTGNTATIPVSLALTGEGTDGTPMLTVSAQNLAFADQVVDTTSAPQVVTLTNSGSANLALSDIAVSGSFGQTNTCTASLRPGASCSVSVIFVPKSLGKQTGALTIASDTAGSPYTVILGGNGTASSTDNPPATVYKLFLPLIKR